MAILETIGVVMRPNSIKEDNTMWIEEPGLQTDP